MRYIDADLIEYEPMCRARGNGMYEDCEIAYKDQIDDIPTADVRENVRGEWLSKNLDNFRKYEVICSVCGARFIGNYDAYDEPYDFNFCPNCGADMRGKE